MIFATNAFFEKKKFLLDWRRVVVDQIISWAAVFFAITAKRFFGGLEGRNDLSLHCTDFFVERRNRSYYLHCLEEVDLQKEVKMMSEVVNL